MILFLRSLVGGELWRQLQKWRGVTWNLPDGSKNRSCSLSLSLSPSLLVSLGMARDQSCDIRHPNRNKTNRNCKRHSNSGSH